MEQRFDLSKMIAMTGFVTSVLFLFGIVLM
jgi:hypothetical protein